VLAYLNYYLVPVFSKWLWRVLPVPFALRLIYLHSRY
jgi:hypothetical protein